MHRFYAPGFFGSELVELPEDEAQHLARVLRLRAGDAIAIFDGSGRESEARIESTTSKRVAVRVGGPRVPAPEGKTAITLAQALLKSDKMDRVIRDAVMLGVAAVQPIVSRRTVVPRAASGTRQDRWTRTVIASIKQCGRAVVPPVHDTQPLDELLTAQAGHTAVMFVEPTCGNDIVDLSSLEGKRPSKATIIIGPEGGWDAEELAHAAAAGVQLVTLGGSILRADAAGAAAIAVLRYVWRDL